MKRTWGSRTYPQAYTYDAQGRVKTLTTWQDFAGESGAAVTTWHYHPQRGWLEGKTYADNRGTDYDYTPAGRLEYRTWARTINGTPLTTTYRYTTGGDLEAIDYSDSTPDVGFTYWRGGARKTMTDATGTRTYTYTAQLRPDQEQLPAYFGNRVLARTYQTTLSLSEPMSIPGRASGFTLGVAADLDRDFATSYGYDAAGRIKRVSSPHGVHDYGYAPQRPWLRQTQSGPVHTATTTWDPGRPNIAKIENKVGPTLVSGYTYTVNDAGQRVQRAQSGTAFAGASTDEFTYNARGEIDTMINATQPARFRGYGYDDIGNRLVAEDSVDIDYYTPNALNQYAELALNGSAPLYPGHDFDGNQTENGFGQTYVWDAENRLIRVQPSGTPVTGEKTVIYTYDGEGRRVSRLVFTYTNGNWGYNGEERFIYDGWNVIATFTYNGYGLNKTLTWGLDLSGTLQGAGGVGGLLSAQEHGGSHAGVYHFTYDANGNVSDVLNNTGATVAHYEYGPFGDPIVATGTYAAANNYRFSTKPVDAESGLYYYGFRYYNPSTGRWPSRDPIGEEGGLNLYSMVGNNPVSRYDILGLYAGFTIRRYNGGLGHQFISRGGVNIGFYGDAAFGTPGGFMNEQDVTDGTPGRPSPNDDNFYYEWDTNKKTSGTFKAGSKKGCPCKSGNEEDVVSCMSTFVQEASQGDIAFNIVLRNCRVMSNRALTSCCLKKGKLIHTPPKGSKTSAGRSSDDSGGASDISTGE